ncbi:hypothetical protein C5B97_14285 [Pseudoclavibacter sp. RFBB5]|nr:hypothetical protein C5B97_14285 [Pseudoclavibacter sp. RFBB5]
MPSRQAGLLVHDVQEDNTMESSDERAAEVGVDPARAEPQRQQGAGGRAPSTPDRALIIGLYGLAVAVVQVPVFAAVIALSPFSSVGMAILSPTYFLDGMATAGSYVWGAILQALLIVLLALIPALVAVVVWLLVGRMRREGKAEQAGPLYGPLAISALSTLAMLLIAATVVVNGVVTASSSLSISYEGSYDEAEFGYGYDDTYVEPSPAAPVVPTFSSLSADEVKAAVTALADETRALVPEPLEDNPDYAQYVGVNEVACGDEEHPGVQAWVSASFRSPTADIDMTAVEELWTQQGLVVSRDTEFIADSTSVTGDGLSSDALALATLETNDGWLYLWIDGDCVATG